MITDSLIELFESIPLPSTESADSPLYSVKPIPNFPMYFVGKDDESLACLLIETENRTEFRHAPIRLQNLDAQFDLHCQLNRAGQHWKQGSFTVIRCRVNHPEFTRFFLSICETIVRELGDQPTQIDIAKAVNYLASIFQKLTKPATRPLIGLFGELYLILRSRNAINALTAWRTSEYSRYDFTNDDLRIDVKATNSRDRIHEFSFEQCNPPAGTFAVIASLYADESAGGDSLYSIVKQIEDRVSSNSDLVFKLHKTVASTLGATVSSSYQIRYDMQLAASSLQFYTIENVPAILSPIPNGVSHVRFRSDLSSITTTSIARLIDLNHKFREILPYEV